MNKWISVDDKLPDEEQHAVLVCRMQTLDAQERDSEYFPYLMGALTDDDAWYDFNDGKRIDLDKWVITHWRELPKLPTNINN